MSETQLRLTLINCAYKPIQTGLGTSRSTVLLGSAFLSQTSAQTDKHRSGGRKDFLVSIHEQVEQQPHGSTLPAARESRSARVSLPSTKSGRLLLAAELDHSLPLTLLWKPQPPAGNGSFNFFKPPSKTFCKLICQHTYSCDMGGDKCGGREFTTVYFQC